MGTRHGLGRWLLTTAAAVLALGAGPASAAPRRRPAPPQTFIDKGDLGAVQARGVLRVLMDPREVPAETVGGALHEREILAAFARSRGLRLQVVEAKGAEDLFALLRAGLGDVVGSGVVATAARRRRVAFTRPIGRDQQFLVGRHGARGPSGPEDLWRWEVHVRPGTALEETAVRLQKGTGWRLKVVRAEGLPDDDALARDVSAGVRPLTLVDGRSLARLQRQHPELRPLFPVVSGLHVALAVRPDNPRLREALDHFLARSARRPNPGRGPGAFKVAAAR